MTLEGGRLGVAGRELPPPPCRCWTSNDNMGFWWILRFPVFLAILVRKRGTCWPHGEG